jgi:hypothetical protein
MKSREAMLRHCAEMLQVKRNILNGAKTYTSEEVREQLKEKYFKDVCTAKK